MASIQDKESGHAAILFVLMFSTLFSLFILGSDGARALQDKARLEEASEVAALTAAAQNSDTESEREETAEKIIQAYFPSASISNIEVTKLSCSENADCDEDDDDEESFFQFGLSVTISQDSWFYSENATTTNMGETYSVAGSSIARKYQSEAVDVVLVADYSGSMRNYWTGGDQRKFEDLNDIIIEVADELSAYNDISDDANKLAVVAFDLYTSKRDGNTRYFAHHLVCTSECSTTKPGVSTSNKNGGKSSSSYDVDADATVASIFTTDEDDIEWLDEDEVTNTSVFQTIALTDDFDSLEDLLNNSSYFNIPSSTGSGTASYTGLIRAAQVAKAGTNPRRLIIILSDGVDSYSTITDDLIDAGLCSTILSTLDEETAADGSDVTAKLAAVGFDYDATDNPQMTDCVGEDNVYEAENTDDIKNKILELISEEIGHSAL